VAIQVADRVLVVAAMLISTVAVDLGIQITVADSEDKVILEALA
jgi:hypothetical protein